MCSERLEAERLADAAEPQNGVHMEGTDAVGPLPAQASWEIISDRVSIPQAGNDLAEDVSRPSSVDSAIANYRGTARAFQWPQSAKRLTHKAMGASPPSSAYSAANSLRGRHAPNGG